MVTARAVTNSVGGISLKGSDLNCTTHQFRVEPVTKGSTMFPEEEQLEWVDFFNLGDLLRYDNDDIDLIANTLESYGLSLRMKVTLRRKVEVRGEKKKYHYEVWTNKERFKVFDGRVYGHKLER